MYPTYTGYAAIASPSDADASEIDGLPPDTPVGMVDLMTGEIMPYSSIGTVVDTVDRSKTFIEVSYQDVSGGQAQTKIFPVDNSGSFSIDVGVGNKILFIAIWFPKEALPRPGKYAFSFDLSSAVGMSYSSVEFYSQRLQSNAAGLWSANTISFQQNSGDLYIAPTVIDLGSVNDCRLGIRFGVNEHLFGGSFRARFESSSASPDITTAGAGSEYAQQDFQNNVSGGVSEIVPNTDIMVDELQKQTEYLPMMSNQIHNVEKAATDGLNKVDSSINNMSSDIQDNQDKNTGLITGALEKLGNFLIDGLKKLFIPDADYFKQLFDRLNTFFSDRFGFLYTPFDLLIRLLTAFMSADSTFNGIPFPGIIVGEWRLVEPMMVNFDVLDSFPGLQDKIYFATNTLLVGAFITLLWHKFEEVMKR